MTSSELKAALESSSTECHRMLMQEYGRYVYAIVYNKLRSCGTNEDIEEGVSDIFADLFIGFEYSSDHIGDIKSFIGTLAKRTAIDYFRKLSTAGSRTVSADDEDMAELVSDIDVDKKVDSSELRRILLASIGSLGEPDSTILIQKFYYGLSSKEIAERVSMTASSVRSRCTRAMEKLRTALAQAGVTREG